MPRAPRAATAAVLLLAALPTAAARHACPVGQCTIEVDETAWSAEERKVGDGATLLLRPRDGSEAQVFLTLRPRVGAEKTPRDAFNRDSRTLRLIYGKPVIAEQEDVVLAGASAHRVSFTAGARRFLRYTLFSGHYTLLFGLSAPADEFDARRESFRPIEASFSLTGALAGAAADAGAAQHNGTAAVRAVQETPAVLVLDGVEHLLAELELQGGDEGLQLRGVRLALRDATGRALSFHWIEGNELAVRLRVQEADGGELPLVTAIPARGRATLFLPRLALPERFSGRGRVEAEVMAVGLRRPLRAVIKPAAPPRTLHMRFPLKGAWRAVRGPTDGDLLRRSTMIDQGQTFIASRYGLDLVAVDSRGERPRGATRNEDYPAFGAPVMAPAAGEVVESGGDLPDNSPGAAGQDPATGNRVRIRHADGAISLLGHLQHGSVRVKAGDKVQAGDQIGAVGNSGRSQEPHLRFEVCDGNRPRCQGLPVIFERLERPALQGWRKVTDSAVDAGWVIRVQ